MRRTPIRGFGQGDSLAAVEERDALVAYVAANADRARLALRGAEPADASAALASAAAAVHAIPHPDEPDEGLPNWCEVLPETDGTPVLHLDMQDHGEQAARVVGVILAAVEAAGVEGRLEPVSPVGPPFTFDPAAQLYGSRHPAMDRLDGRGLPPGMPAALPVPDGLLVQAQRDEDGVWAHAAWRHTGDAEAFGDYPERLRGAGFALNEYPVRRPEERGGLRGYVFAHASCVGLVWLYHERLDDARRHGRRRPGRWYLSLVWAPAGTPGERLPLPGF